MPMARAEPDHNHHVSESDVKAPNIFERAKEEIEAIMHSGKAHHHGESHGTSPEIDENTPVDEVKAPNIFRRAKEEIEVLVEAIHPKKESDNGSSSNEGGYWGFFARSENVEDAKGSLIKPVKSQDGKSLVEIIAPNIKQAKEGVESHQ